MKNRIIKELNILHLESSPGWGGQEIRILKESEGMRVFGHNVIMAVQKNGGLANQARKKRFLVYEINYKKAFWPISFFRLVHIIKKHNIKIINTHSSDDSWLGGIIARLFKVPVIRTRHLSTRIKKGLNSRLLYGYLTDFVVTTCREAADIIIKQSKKEFKKCLSIPTGIDIADFNVKPFDIINFKNKYNIKCSDFLVGTACFMRSWKGIDDFLKTAKLLENEKDIKFVLIGGGHVGAYLKLAEEMKLNNVVFTGHLENPTYAIAALDVFVLLSTAHEGVAQASLQAAYLEKPLITTPTGGLKEVCIDNETGIQVNIFAPNETAGAILKLKNDYKLRQTFAKNAKCLAMRFTLDNMVRQMQDVYFQLTDLSQQSD